MKNSLVFINFICPATQSCFSTTLVQSIHFTPFHLDHSRLFVQYILISFTRKQWRNFAWLKASLLHKYTLLLTHKCFFSLSLRIIQTDKARNVSIFLLCSISKKLTIQKKSLASNLSSLHSFGIQATHRHAYYMHIHYFAVSTKAFWLHKRGNQASLKRTNQEEFCGL